MKKSELVAMSLKQLVAIQTEISTLIETKRQEEHASLREKLSKMAADAGFRLETVLEAGNSKSKRSGKPTTVPVKYRDPANPETNTWSGRGRPARWIAAYLKAGKKLDQFRVA